MVDGDEMVHCGPASGRWDLQDFPLYTMYIFPSLNLYAQEHFLQTQPVLNVHSHELYEC